MAETYETELFRQEGVEFRSVRLEVREDGALRLDCQDMGEAAERVWGADGYEFWVDVPAGELRKLALALLREKYANRAGAVDEFRDSCKGAGIEHHWDSWI